MRCIAIRAAYGGMAGDVDMLKNFVAVWSTRSATTATVLKNSLHHTFLSVGCRPVAKLMMLLYSKHTWCAHMHDAIRSFSQILHGLHNTSWVVAVYCMCTAWGCVRGYVGDPLHPNAAWGSLLALQVPVNMMHAALQLHKKELEDCRLPSCLNFNV